VASTSHTENLRQAALKYLFPHRRGWIEMAEAGGPMLAVEGHGIRITDSEGKTWIDVNGGYNSVNVGYGRTEIAEAAREQALKLSYFPAGTTAEPTIRLAEKLAQITPGDLSRTYFVNGGSEAIETGLKIVRAYHRRNGEPGRYKVISRRGSYHGFTGGVIWLGGGASSGRDDIEPAYPGMVYAPQPVSYNCELGGTTPSECAVLCAQAIEDLIQSEGPETVAAVIGEPVAAGSGAPGDEYWPMVREICDRYGVLLISDEVICGFGRTGKMFAVEHWDIVPDVLTLAKGIVSTYLPIAATVVRKEIADAFAGEENKLVHTLTFSGHPVSAAAALKNIEILERENLVENSAVVGAYFKEQMEGLMIDHPIIGDVRGLGLLVQLELVSDRQKKTRFPKEVGLPARLNEGFRKHGLILRVGGDTMAIGPPLCITEDEVNEIVHAIDLTLWEVEGQLGIATTT
jgi:adenosylmethionine-8-amino-7-oxononanoate aminotransferase